MTPKCDHCRRQMAFGIFELVLNRTKQTITKNLCADCGFNVTKYRTMRIHNFERTYTPPTGGERTVQQEAMTFQFLYASCKLVETFTGTLVLAKLDEDLRAEQAAAYLRAKSQLVVQRNGRGRISNSEPARPVLVVGKATPRGASLSGPPRTQTAESSSRGVTGPVVSEHVRSTVSRPPTISVRR